MWGANPKTYLLNSTTCFFIEHSSPWCFPSIYRQIQLYNTRASQRKKPRLRYATAPAQCTFRQSLGGGRGEGGDALPECPLATGITSPTVLITAAWRQLLELKRHRGHRGGGVGGWTGGISGQAVGFNKREAEFLVIRHLSTLGCKDFLSKWHGERVTPPPFPAGRGSITLCPQKRAFGLVTVMLTCWSLQTPQPLPVPDVQARVSFCYWRSIWNQRVLPAASSDQGTSA